MKKLMVMLAAAGTLAAPQVATAGHMDMMFDNRGQCESYLAKMRNDERKSARHMGMHWDKKSWDDHGYYCHMNDDGSYSIMMDMDSEDD